MAMVPSIMAPIAILIIAEMAKCFMFFPLMHFMIKGTVINTTINKV